MFYTISYTVWQNRNCDWFVAHFSSKKSINAYSVGSELSRWPKSMSRTPIVVGLLVQVLICIHGPNIYDWGKVLKVLLQSLVYCKSGCYNALLTYSVVQIFVILTVKICTLRIKIQKPCVQHLKNKVLSLCSYFLGNYVLMKPLDRFFKRWNCNVVKSMTFESFPQTYFKNGSVWPRF